MKRQLKQNEKKRVLLKGRQDKTKVKKVAEEEITQLVDRITKETPPSGSYYYKYQEKADSIPLPSMKIIPSSDKDLVKIRFADLPISRKTKSGLYKSKFIKMTEV